MTTLLPDRAAARTTRIAVGTTGTGPLRVRTRTEGDRETPGLRPMLLRTTPERAVVSLVPDGALLLAGDHVRLEVEVGPGARLDLVEPAGTVAYEMRGGSARWDVRLTLHAGSQLTWAGEPFVVAAGARVDRTTEVVLAEDAVLRLRETLVLGRHGERAGTLDQRWVATRPDGVPLLVEHLRLDERAHRPGLLGGHRVLAAVTALGGHVEPGAAQEGRLDLETGGTTWRRLGHAAHEAGLEDTWQVALGA